MTSSMLITSRPPPRYSGAHFVTLDIVKQDQWDAAVEQVKKETGASTCS
jgi:hypothetical protein